MIRNTKKTNYIIGIDEVGRGPLAGPVTVCAFAIPKENIRFLDHVGAKDSKVLSEKKRQVVVFNLKKLVKEKICTYQITSVSSKIIDRKGLTYAITCAIERTLNKLGISPDNTDIYLDGGLKAPKAFLKQQTIIKGDGLIPVISCASVLAKVHRDNLMNKYHKEFPGYGLIKNKGYGTSEHYCAIQKLGITRIHRRLFLRSILA